MKASKFLLSACIVLLLPVVTLAQSPVDVFEKASPTITNNSLASLRIVESFISLVEAAIGDAKDASVSSLSADVKAKLNTSLLALSDHLRGLEMTVAEIKTSLEATSPVKQTESVRRLGEVRQLILVQIESLAEVKRGAATGRGSALEILGVVKGLRASLPTVSGHLVVAFGEALNTIGELKSTHAEVLRVQKLYGQLRTLFVKTSDLLIKSSEGMGPRFVSYISDGQLVHETLQEREKGFGDGVTRAEEIRRTRLLNEVVASSSSAGKLGNIIRINVRKLK
jgi:hypothetical protein